MDDDIDLDAEGGTGDNFTSPRSPQSVDSFAIHSSAIIASKPQIFGPSAQTLTLATPSRTAPSSDFFPSPLTSATVSPPSIQTTCPSHAYSANEYSNLQAKVANKLQTVANQVEYCAPPAVHDYASFPDLHQTASPTFSKFSGSAAEESTLSVPSSGNLSLFHGNWRHPLSPGVDVQAQMQLQYLCLQQQQKLIHAPIAQPIDISPLPPAMSLPTPGLYLPPVTIQATTSTYIPVSQGPNLSHIHALPHQTQYQRSVAPTPTFQTYVTVNYQGPIQLAESSTLPIMEQLTSWGRTRPNCRV
ncbi:hypothetical protein BT69DRAFT_117601 [Atractiella rhizophila]|nr:hypothetical protein BT69DRAFT_117601 [Atractiella rhizophila]